VIVIIVVSRAKERQIIMVMAGAILIKGVTGASCDFRLLDKCAIQFRDT
jgi:hypothetical protein